MTEKPKGLSTGRKLRLALAMIMILVTVGFATFIYLLREPSFEGQALSDWVGQLATSDVQATNTPTEQALRSIGSKSLPLLVEWIRPPKRASRFKILMTRLSKLLHGSIYLAEPPMPIQAIHAFQILGPVAKPAIPQLEEILLKGTNDQMRGEFAAEALAGIGKDSLTVLTNCLAATNETVRQNALLGLSELGEQASTAAPLVESLIHNSNISTSADAVLTLSRFGEGAGPYVPELHEMLKTNNQGFMAAVALSHLGYSYELLRNLTNQSTMLRKNCGGALAFSGLYLARENIHWLGGTGRYIPGFSDFPSDPRRDADFSTVFLLNSYLKSTNSLERAQAADDLGFFAEHACLAVASLSHTLSDTDEIVRHSAAEALKKIGLQVQDGGIIRGPREEKKIALEFTGHQFAEGGDTILSALAQHQAKASFFLTGDFLRNPGFRPLVERMASDGHYIGSHSDKHLLYCEWGTKKTLVTKKVFEADAFFQDKVWHSKSNIFNLPNRLWIPPYEWYNQQIADWSSDMGLVLVDYTPGTRSNADYTQESDTNFVSSQAIFDSILKKEREDPDGLNGFLLLMHLGAGPGRKDKFYPRLGELLDVLSAKGYQFVRIDELLGEGPAN